MSKKSYTLKLTFSTIVTACIVLFIGIGWSFVLGVMVGRGYNPEKQVPQLANLLPAEEAENKDPLQNLGDTLPKGEVIKPENLSYATSLKGKPGQPPTESAPKNMQNATAPVSVPVAAQPQHPAPMGGIAQINDSTKPKPPPAPQQDQEQIFDFIFQVATFKDEVSVDKLRAKLEGEGMRTRMDKDGKLLKVMVLMRGTNEQAQELRQHMVDLKLGQPIQRSKTLVKGKRAR